MQRILTSILLILITIHLPAQTTKRTPFEKLVKKGDVYYLDNVLFTGISLSFFPDTETRQRWQEIEWANGKINGYFKTWNQKGLLVQEIYYQNGVRHGSYKGWFPNGKPYIVTSYKNGERHGMYHE